MVVQVCVVGINEYKSDDKLDAKVHVYLYDGEEQDACGYHHTEPSGGGWWGEETASNIA